MNALTVPDTDLDSRISKLLNWQPPSGMEHARPPSYSESWCAVSVLVSVLIARGFRVTMQSDHHGMWFALVFKDGRVIEHNDPNLAKAVALSFVEALEQK